MVPSQLLHTRGRRFMPHTTSKFLAYEALATGFKRTAFLRRVGDSRRLYLLLGCNAAKAPCPSALFSSSMTLTFTNRRRQWQAASRHVALLVNHFPLKWVSDVCRRRLWDADTSTALVVEKQRRNSKTESYKKQQNFPFSSESFFEKTAPKK